MDKKLSAAITIVQNKHKIVAIALSRMTINVSDSSETKTACTDCHKNIWFNKYFCSNLNLKQMVFLLMHESCHKLFQDHLRRGDRNPWLYNVAADFYINKYVEKEMGGKINDIAPSYEGELSIDDFWTAEANGGILYDSAVDLSQDTAESIYDRLFELKPDNINIDGLTGIDIVKGIDGLCLEDDGDGDEDEESKREGNRKGSKENGSENKSDSARDNDTERYLEARITANAVESFVRNKGGGSGSLNMQRSFANVKPKLDPRRLLFKQAVNAKTNPEYTMRRLNRRLLMGNPPLAGSTLQESYGKDLIVAIDTSASVTKSDLSQYAADINQVRMIIKPEITHVIYIDSEICGVESLNLYEPTVLRMRGGGGTSFKPLFNWLEEEGCDPSLVMYFTDGYADTDFLNEVEDPPCFAWCIYNGDDHFNAPFGQILRFNND